MLRVFVAFAIAAIFALPSRAQDRPPNIIHILADDVGYDDVGCFGAPKIKTPNIDELAAGGMRFTHFYAPCSTCTPSRCAILTGVYPERTGVARVLNPKDTIGISDREITIAQLLKQRGYATALIGKWHLGHQAPFLPTKHGFDFYFGIPYPNDHDPVRPNFRYAPPMPLYRNDQIVEQPAQLETCPDRFTQAAVQFIRDNKDRPFFLHLAPIETHTPWFVAPRHMGKSADGPFGDAVESLDWTVGQVMAELRILGLEKNTLVVFSSDNGPLVHRYADLETAYGRFATVDLTRPHLLTEGKYQSRWEGGTRVACAMHWPGKIPAGKTCAELTAGFDLFTTFATVAGAQIPKDRIIDGKDLTPLMTATEGTKSPHEAFYYYQNFRLSAVRSGQWKLAFPGGVKGNKPNSPPTTLALFDVVEDPAEEHNVAADHPDEVKRLQEIAEKAREDLGDTATKRPAKNVRLPGRVD